MKTVIFTLTSARSGTLYLRSLFAHNVPGCVCRHEPFFDFGNPTLFGRAIYDAYAHRTDRIGALLAKKRRYIERLPGHTYLESSHAFLKSSYLAALEYFPDMRLVHLIRDPLKVAKSEAYRLYWRERLHAPFHFYTGDDGRRHFAWALTGNEQIFLAFQGRELTRFQWCLIQWIEIENRAIRFLRQHGLEDRCATLHSPADLNNADKVRAMFQFLNLPVATKPIQLRGRKNRSLGTKTVITPGDEAEAEAVLNQMPLAYLEIFDEDPYLSSAWSARLRRAARLAAVPTGSAVPVATR